MKAMRSLVPLAHVRSLPDSIAFYRKLGFEVRNTLVPEGRADPTWAWLESEGGAKLMLALADEPVIAAQQAVLFYLYCDSVPSIRARLEESGVPVGPVQYPFYATLGEFRVHDPDGYVLLIMQT
jgi:catechol 2,3-dioxygenase-like lactoylglutathione lyase family enzyme